MKPLYAHISSTCCFCIGVAVEHVELPFEYDGEDLTDRRLPAPGLTDEQDGLLMLQTPVSFRFDSIRVRRRGGYRICVFYLIRVHI